MTIVVDSNIFLASVLVDEPLTAVAKTALAEWTNNNEAFVAPILFKLELTAVLRRAVFQKRISHERGRFFLEILLEQPVEFHQDDDLLLDAYEIATRFNLPRAYDSQYLALAERLNCEFWTADETLYNSISARFSYIRWLGNFKTT